MIINSGNLDALRVGFSTAFQRVLSQAPSDYTRVATVVRSTNASNKYGWLGNMPGMREWLGDRVVHGLSEHDYTLVNKPFELTVGVKRDDIEDDNLGVYTPMIEMMASAAGSKPDEMVFAALKNGFSSACFDGQNFFDTDHPVIAADGSTGTASNTGGGSGTPWFLLCTNRPIKPIIHQVRKPAQFVAMDKPDDARVFSRGELTYGVDGRWATGYGLWQLAYGSKQTLDAASYEAARVSIMARTGDQGRPLGLVPNLLVVPVALEGAAREILMSERNEAGATNKWRGTAELLVSPWLV